jgi:Arc/MetJ family transcription regulator
MTTTISISPQLLDAVLKLTQATTKHQAVEIALKTFIQLNQQEQIRAY